MSRSGRRPQSWRRPPRPGRRCRTPRAGPTTTTPARAPRSGTRQRALRPQQQQQQQQHPAPPPPPPQQLLRPPRARRPCPRPPPSAPRQPAASRRPLTSAWQPGRGNSQQRGGRRRRARSPLPVRGRARLLPLRAPRLSLCRPPHNPRPPFPRPHCPPPPPHAPARAQTREKSLRGCSSTPAARQPLQCPQPPQPRAARCRRCRRAGPRPLTPAARRSTFSAATGRRRGRGPREGRGGGPLEAEMKCTGF